MLLLVGTASNLQLLRLIQDPPFHLLAAICIMATTTTTSVLGKAALNVIAAYESWTIDNIMDIRAPDCISEVQPGKFSPPPVSSSQSPLEHSKLTLTFACL
jgi:hypothetical protein